MKESSNNLASKLVLLATSVFFGHGQVLGNNLVDDIGTTAQGRFLSFPEIISPPPLDEPKTRSHDNSSPPCYPIASKVKIESTTGTNLNMFEVSVLSSGMNVALGKPAFQSSDYNASNTASYAVDNDLSTFSQTNDSNAWWMVDLGYGMPLRSLDIANVYCGDVTDITGCLCRLSYAKISLLDDLDNVVGVEFLGDTCGELDVYVDLASHAYCPHSIPMARYVGILQNVTSEQLAMFEVQVFSNGTNVAVGKYAEQSSTLVENGVPRLAMDAVDGSLSTFSHTDCSDPWWIVDLGCEVPIENVTIVNKWCEDPSDAPGCLCQLSFAMVVLFDEMLWLVDYEETGDTCGVHESVHFITTPSPTPAPSMQPSLSPSVLPSKQPSFSPTEQPTDFPSMFPTASPTFGVTDPSNLSCPLARYVKISGTTEQQLTFFEIEVISGGNNVALGKFADQSSTLIDVGNIPRLAIDAVDGSLATFSHTDCSDPWWIVDLGELFPIEHVNIKNYWCDDPSDAPGCLCMLSNATLELLDGADMVVESVSIGDTCGIEELSYNFCDTESPTAAPTVFAPLTCPLARYVKISGTTEEQLAMFEVRVMSGGNNVALGKFADQSSTLIDVGNIPRLAVDAVDGSLSTFSHTDCSNPWWIVDLGELFPVQDIVIMNYWCDDPSDAPGCLCMLSNASLSLLDGADMVVDSVSIGDTCGVEELSYNFCDTESPSCAPTAKPTASPSLPPSASPSKQPTLNPTASPSLSLSMSPSLSPSLAPSDPSGFTCDEFPEARYVKISQTITDEQLAMFEVLVFSNGTNVALGKPSNQSSTLIVGSVPMIAPNAVDGSLATYSHTDCDDPYWIVDLGCMMPIEVVTIMNKWCEDPSDGPGCLCKLSNATLELLDTNMSVVQTKQIGDTCCMEELTYNFCVDATESPECAPTAKPTAAPTELITASPSASPSISPITPAPSNKPTNSPVTSAPSSKPTMNPSKNPSQSPSASPSFAPSFSPTMSPSIAIVTPEPTPAFNAAPPAPVPIVVSVPGSMALDNFVIPATQEEYDAVVGILEVTIQQTVESTLSEGQSLSDVSVTSIGGQNGVRRRFLETTTVEYVMTLEKSCTTNCDDAASDLSDAVTAALASSVESGAFVSNLKTNAETNASAASLANVTAFVDGVPTKNPTEAITAKPTLRPSSAPTSHNSQALPADPKPTSSGGRLSSHVVYTLVSVVVVFFII